MSYQNPAVGYLHMAREAVSVVASDTVDPDYPITRLYDNRPDAPFQWDGSYTNPTVTLDMGGQVAHDWLYIPAGHNLGGLELQVRDSVDNFAANDRLVSNFTVPAGDAAISHYPYTIIANPDRQYVRLVVLATGQFRLHELVFSQRHVIGNGPDPRWGEPHVPLMAVNETPAGIVTANVTGATRRALTLTYRAYQQSEVDAMEGLIAATGNGPAAPFLMDVPNSVQDPSTLWAKLQAPIEKTQASGVPQGAIRYDYAVRAREQ